MPSAATEAGSTSSSTSSSARGGEGRRAIGSSTRTSPGSTAQYRKAGLALAALDASGRRRDRRPDRGLFGAGGGDEIRRSRFLVSSSVSSAPRSAGRSGRTSACGTIPRRASPSQGTAYGSRDVARSGTSSSTAARRRHRAASPAGEPPADVERVARRRAKRSATGKPLVVMGPQVGHYYPEHPAGARSRGRRLPGARRGVPRDLVRDPHRSRDRLRVERDLGRLRPRRPVRRDALRRKRHEVPLPRRVPRDDDASTPARSGAPGEPDQPLVFRETVHGPVIGLRDRRGQARRDLRQALDPWSELAR